MTGEVVLDGGYGTGANGRLQGAESTGVDIGLFSRCTAAVLTINDEGAERDGTGDHESDTLMDHTPASNKTTFELLLGYGKLGLLRASGEQLSGNLAGTLASAGFRKWQLAGVTLGGLGMYRVDTLYCLTVLTTARTRLTYRAEEQCVRAQLETG